VKQKPTRKPPKSPTSLLKEEDEKEEDEIQVGRFPLETEFQLRKKSRQDKT
jgi:hypothetical protein